MNLDQMPKKMNPGPAQKEPTLPATPESAPHDGIHTPLSAGVNINAAFPNLVLAALYALAAFRGTTLPFLDGHLLGSLMGIEFLVIHSFPFMMFLGSAHPPHELGRKCQKIAFWGLFIIYFLFAAQLGGLAGMVGFASLTMATYLGYMFRRTSPDAVVQLAARWVMSFLLFMICSRTTGMPADVDDWPDHGRVLYFGFSYFMLLGVLEATGFYQCKALRTMTEHIRRQFEKKWH